MEVETSKCIELDPPTAITILLDRICIVVDIVPVVDRFRKRTGNQGVSIFRSLKSQCFAILSILQI